jgi:hypothetical protein
MTWWSTSWTSPRQNCIIPIGCSAFKKKEEIPLPHIGARLLTQPPSAHARQLNKPPNRHAPTPINYPLARAHSNHSSNMPSIHPLLHNLLSLGPPLSLCAQLQPPLPHPFSSRPAGTRIPHTPPHHFYWILGFNLVASVFIFGNNAEGQAHVKITQAFMTVHEILRLWRKLHPKFSCFSMSR